MDGAAIVQTAHLPAGLGKRASGEAKAQQLDAKHPTAATQTQTQLTGATRAQNPPSPEQNGGRTTVTSRPDLPKT